MTIKKETKCQHNTFQKNLFVFTIMHELVPENGSSFHRNEQTDWYFWKPSRYWSHCLARKPQRSTGCGVHNASCTCKSCRERGGASVTTDCTAVPYALKRGYGPTSFSYSPGGDVPSRFARESVPSRPFLLEQRQHLSGKQWNQRQHLSNKPYQTDVSICQTNHMKPTSASVRQAMKPTSASVRQTISNQCQHLSDKPYEANVSICQTNHETNVSICQTNHMKPTSPHVRQTI